MLALPPEGGKSCAEYLTFWPPKAAGLLFDPSRGILAFFPPEGGKKSCEE